MDIIIGWKLSKEGIKGEKYKDYKQYRPEEEEIAELEGLVADVFKAFVENTMAVKEYLKCEDEKKAAKFRNGDGGNILFRPAILTEYIYVATLLYDKFNDWTKVFVVLNNISHELNDEPWKGYLWDGKKIGRRISKVLTRQVLLYMVDQNLLDDKKEKFIEEYARAINKNQNEAKEVLDKSIANNR